MTAKTQTIALRGRQVETTAPNWKNLYTAGGVSALVIGLLLLFEMIIYLATSAPSLADAAAWFALFQRNRFIGLLDFGILELYALIFFVPLFLALYAALRRAAESTMAIAAVLAFVGIAVNFATGKLFSLLTLSDLYAAAVTAAQKSQFLAAAHAALAVGALGGIGGSVEGGIPLAVAGLISSVVMLRSNILGKAAGYAGLLANGVGLLMYFNAPVAPAFAGSPFFGAFFLLSVLWYILVARGLFRFGRSVA